jgi:hypothetical protein
MRKIFAVMAAALALAATRVSAEGGGGGSGAGAGSGSGSGSGSGQGSGSGDRSGTSGGGAVSGSTHDQQTDEAAAAQKAPSVAPTEGAGGKAPHPQAQGQGDARRYGEAPAQSPGQEGRPPNQTPSQATTSPGTNAPGQPSEVSGRVALVDVMGQELAIDAGTATTQVKVAPDAQITIDGKRASLKDIHQGAQVRASLERSGDETHAKKIEVTSTAPKKK